MSFFEEDDPFENIIREFFRGSNFKSQEREMQNEKEERIIDFIETKNNIFIIFELPGYSKEDISLTIDKRNIEIKAKKKNFEKVQNYLSQRLLQGVLIKKSLPNFIKTKDFNYTFKNGVLEIIFNKK